MVSKLFVVMLMQPKVIQDSVIFLGMHKLRHLVPEYLVRYLLILLEYLVRNLFHSASPSVSVMMVDKDCKDMSS